MDIDGDLGELTSVVESTELATVASMKEEDTIEFPFWKLKQEEISEALSPFMFLSEKGTDLVSKSVYLKPVQGGLLLVGTNKDVFCSLRVPTHNHQNHLEKAFIVDAKILNGVVRSSTGNLYIFFDGTSLRARVLGGDVALETYNFPDQVFSYKVPENSLTVDETLLLSLCDTALKASNLAIRPEDKKIVVKEGVAYGSYLSSIFTYSIGLPNMVLRKSDMQFMRKVLGSLGGTIQFFEDENTIGFFGDKFYFSSKKVNSDIPADVLSIARMQVADIQKVSIDSQQLFKVFSLGHNFLGPSGNMFLISSDYGVKVRMTTRSGKESIFTVSQDNFGDFSSAVPIAQMERVALIFGEVGVLSLTKLVVQTSSFLLVSDDVKKVFIGMK